MGDGQHAESPFGHLLLHPTPDRTQRVDVQSGVDLVEDGEAGTQHAQLERLVAFAFPARKVDVEGPVEEALVEADATSLLGQPLPGIDGTAAPGLAGRDLRSGRGERRHQRDPGNLDGMLHAQEQSGTSPLPGRKGEKVDAVEGHRTAQDLVARPAHQHVGQGALPRSVGPHDGVHLAAAHGEGDAAEDLPAGYAGPEILDAQLPRAHGTTTETSSPSTATA